VKIVGPNRKSCGGFPGRQYFTVSNDRAMRKILHVVWKHNPLVTRGATALKVGSNFLRNSNSPN